MSSTKIYQIEIITLRREKIAEVLPKLGAAMREWASKLNGRNVGIFTCTLGAAFEVLLLVEYESLQARVDANHAAFNSPQLYNYFSTIGPAEQDVKVWFTRSAPGFNSVLPVRGNLIMMRYETDGIIHPQALKNLYGELDSVARHTNTHDVCLTAVLTPVFSEQAHCAFALWDVRKDIPIDYVITPIQEAYASMTSKGLFTRTSFLLTAGCRQKPRPCEQALCVDILAPSAKKDSAIRLKDYSVKFFEPVA